VDNMPAALSAGDFAPKIIHLSGMTPRALSRKDAGAFLDVSSKTIERLIGRGELPAFKVLGQWRIMISDLQAFVERQQREQKRRMGTS